MCDVCGEIFQEYPVQQQIDMMRGVIKGYL